MTKTSRQKNTAYREISRYYWGLFLVPAANLKRRFMLKSVGYRMIYTDNRLINIVISDDHSIVRQGLIDIFRQRKDVNIVGQADSTQSTIDICRTLMPDLLVMDLNLDNTSGIQTIEAVKEAYPNANLLIFSMRESLSTIKTSYELGAKGYVTKSSGPELLLEAIDKIATGELYFMPEYAEKILKHNMFSEDKDPRQVLSPKELDLFVQLAIGKTNEEISDSLNISVKSVSNRSIEIRNKLNIKQTDIGWIARKYNLIEMEL